MKRTGLNSMSIQQGSIGMPFSLGKTQASTTAGRAMLGLTIETLRARRSERKVRAFDTSYRIAADYDSVLPLFPQMDG